MRVNVADLLISGFIFLLFVSIYRKRSTSAVRFWVVGWFCVLLHFGALAFHPQTAFAVIAQEITALCTLVLCGTAFALSFPAAHTSIRPQTWTAALLATPWLMTMIFGCLSEHWFPLTAFCGLCSAICTLGVCWRLFAGRQFRLATGVLLVAECTAWLITVLTSGDSGTIQEVVLTLCFGLNAILLSRDILKPSAASLTMSVGAIAWGAVWVSATLLAHFAPGVQVSPEVWNLPKYFVAAGMVLSLLESEIRSAEVASEEYRLLFAGNPHPMWIYDPETLAFLDVNDAAVAHYGYSREEFRNMTLVDVTDLGSDAGVIEDLRTNEPQKLSGPWLHRRRDGSEFQVDIASQPVIRDGQRATFALIHDVTEPQRLHAQLIRQAHHDVLTDLPNRALFEQRLESTVDEAAQTGRKAAVLCIDLDRFKQINDTFGHGAGDQCLREMSRRITQCLGTAGTLARTGGDEFMLALGNMRDAREAESFATALLEDLKPWVSLERGEVELVASIGIAVFPDDGEDTTHLWRDADAAMYRAKRAGGAQWVRVSKEISNSVSEANEIELSLRRALKVGDFEVYYQPQMTADGSLHSLEALVRSREALLSRTSPERFIPIAEESGLIVPMGEWMLERVCRQMRFWLDEGRPPVQVAVNVSPLQLARFDFFSKVASTLERYQLSPQTLEFEVTESTVMSDRGDAPYQIAMLARMGIRFSVDDFGTGYSSLGRLHQLPVESLKIDRSFTRRIGERKGTYPTVRAIIALAHTFGMKVVAEGVETEEQLRILRALECDRVQGYLFSRPLPADQVQVFLPAPADIGMQKVAV